MACVGWAQESPDSVYDELLSYWVAMHCDVGSVGPSGHPWAADAKQGPGSIFAAAVTGVQKKSMLGASRFFGQPCFISVTRRNVDAIF